MSQPFQAIRAEASRIQEAGNNPRKLGEFFGSTVPQSEYELIDRGWSFIRHALKKIGGPNLAWAIEGPHALSEDEAFFYLDPVEVASLAQALEPVTVEQLKAALNAADLRKDRDVFEMPPAKHADDFVNKLHAALDASSKESVLEALNTSPQSHEEREALPEELDIYLESFPHLKEFYRIAAERGLAVLQLLG